MYVLLSHACVCFGVGCVGCVLCNLVQFNSNEFIPSRCPDVKISPNILRLHFCGCVCDVCNQGNCFAQPFDDEQRGEGGDDDDEDEDDDMVDGNVAYASCDLVGAYAKVSWLGWFRWVVNWLVIFGVFVSISKLVFLLVGLLIDWAGLWLVWFGSVFGLCWSVGLLVWFLAWLLEIVGRLLGGWVLWHV